MQAHHAPSPAHQHAAQTHAHNHTHTQPHTHAHTTTRTRTTRTRTRDELPRERDDTRKTLVLGAVRDARGLLQVCRDHRVAQRIPVCVCVRVCVWWLCVRACMCVWAGVWGSAWQRCARRDVDAAGSSVPGALHNAACVWHSVCRQQAARWHSPEGQLQLGVPHRHKVKQARHTCSM
jgi:hypothetical protein